MQHIHNISITARARPLLRRELGASRPRQGDVTALVHISTFTNADGTTVQGFEPGYMVGPVSDGHFGKVWALARLRDGTAFLFMPKFTWRAEENYLVDLASETFALFSIGPA